MIDEKSPVQCGDLSAFFMLEPSLEKCLVPFLTNETYACLQNEPRRRGIGSIENTLASKHRFVIVIFNAWAL